MLRTIPGGGGMKIEHGMVHFQSTSTTLCMKIVRIFSDVYGIHLQCWQMPQTIPGGAGGRGPPEKYFLMFMVFTCCLHPLPQPKLPILNVSVPSRRQIATSYMGGVQRNWKGRRRFRKCCDNHSEAWSSFVGMGYKGKGCALPQGKKIWKINPIRCVQTLFFIIFAVSMSCRMLHWRLV